MFDVETAAGFLGGQIGPLLLMLGEDLSGEMRRFMVPLGIGLCGLGAVRIPLQSNALPGLFPLLLGLLAACAFKGLAFRLWRGPR